jgi:hypothetical protein
MVYEIEGVRAGAKPVAAWFILVLAQPRARSAVVSIDKDYAGRFERALDHLDVACLHRAPTLEVSHCIRCQFSCPGEVTQAPPKSRSRKPALQRDNAPHGDNRPAIQRYQPRRRSGVTARGMDKAVCRTDRPA